MPQHLIDDLEPRRVMASIASAVTQTVALNATTAKQKDFTVSLKAGQAIVVAAGDLGTSSFSPEILLLNSSGTQLAKNGGDTGAFFSTTVGTAGTYTIRVRDVGQNQSGNVRLTAFYGGSSTITDSDDAYTAQSGRRFAATMQPGDLDVWKITAKAGQFISTVATENNAGSALDLGVILVDPAGKIVATKTSETGVKIDKPSAAAGTYYAVVYEPGQNDTGRYGISFAQTPGVQYSGDPDTQSPLVSGTPRTGDLPGGDIDVFQVSVTKGKVINLLLARTTGSLDPEIVLIDPAGKQVKTTNGSTNTSLSYTALTSGTYSILIRDRESDDGGQYRLTYKLS